MEHVMPIKKYEYRRVYASPIRFRFNESFNLDHRFNYIRRRDILLNNSVSYQPFCSCKKWKGDTWYGSRRVASEQHLKHVREVEATVLRFPL